MNKLVAATCGLWLGLSEIDADHAGYLRPAEIENFAIAKFASKTGPL